MCIRDSNHLDIHLHLNYLLQYIIKRCVLVVNRSALEYVIDYSTPIEHYTVDLKYNYYMKLWNGFEINIQKINEMIVMKIRPTSMS